MVIYSHNIYSCLSGGNIQHSMLYFRKERTASIWKRLKEIIFINYVIIFGNSQQFHHRCIYGMYSLHEVPASPYTSGDICIQQEHDQNSRYLMLSLLCIYFS